MPCFAGALSASMLTAGYVALKNRRSKFALSVLNEHRGKSAQENFNAGIIFRRYLPMQLPFVMGTK
ncbi:MAG: hypothetical protein H7A09_00115 [Oceanospirillaceae bacterium]|nr:hypothetical protein [Oceanospirillaceae bacterium]MCP5334810.1 hypothetical protein [Oceanospirillaceae bacterium]MCP5350482.1 hypothetical protein [Oceanospirillaceae bacterium]